MKRFVATTEQVRSLLETGRARFGRLVKLHKRAYTPDLSWIASINPDGVGGWVAWGPKPVTDEFSTRAYPNGGGFKCPFGQLGDVLWVAETWAQKEDWPGSLLAYKADWRTPDRAIKTMGTKWRSSTTMPQWASRLTVTVSDVRAELVDGVWMWTGELEVTR